MGGPSRVRVTGPLAEYADGFAAQLAEVGYTPLSAANQLRVMARLSRWLVVSGLAPAGADRGSGGCVPGRLPCPRLYVLVV